LTDAMQRAPIDLYVFSGTGNTLLVARAMCETFVRHGLQANLFRMERTDPGSVDTSHVLGLAFPVAAQSTYPLVWRFAQRLPFGDGAPVFMVDTMAGYSGGVVGPMRSLIERRGYRPIGAREFVMPLNCMRRRIDIARDSAKVVRGLVGARQYAEDLLEGRAAWGRVPVLADIVRYVASGPLTWWLACRLGERIRVDKTRCSQCELCVGLCPVGNIGFDRYPVFGSECNQCMRCVSFCPRQALALPILNGVPYRAVSIDEMLSEGDGQAACDARRMVATRMKER